jgi:Flp pilus assembly protein TadD
MGSVYQVGDLRRPGATYALKELLDDGSLSPDDLAWATERFQAEIALLARLHHPRIPAFVEQFVEHGRRYFVMEYIPGETLEERLLRSRAPLPEPDVLRWTLGVCEALEYLHRQRPPIIARDLKPGNIMVTPQGEARLIDFGIARTYKAGQAANTENLGTVTYASPEHHGRGQTDARSDIYSLGATMFHLLAGHEPTPLETPALGSLRRSMPALSEATERVVLRAMRLNPAERFQSVAEMRAALQACLDALPTSRAPHAMPSVDAPIAPRSSTSPSAAPGISAPARAAARPAPKKAASAPAVPARRPASAGTTATSGPRMRCPRCGYLNRAGAKFCARDGAPLRSATNSPAPAAPTPAPITRVVATPTAQLRRATEALAAGQASQAILLAEGAIAQGQATYELHLLLGRAYLAAGHAREAAEAFAAAGRMRSTAEALALEGAARLETSQLAEALVALTRARQLAPADAEISLRLGELCLRQGQLAQAEGELRDGLARHPGHAALLHALGRVHAARQQWPEATNLLRQATLANPTDLAAYMTLGRTLLEAGRPGEAVRSMEDATRRFPHCAEAFTILGLAYSRQGRDSQARKALRKATALDPRNPEAQRLLISTAARPTPRAML